MTKLTQEALDQLFVKARTANRFQNKPVSIETLHELYNIARMGPTSMNAQPARFVFLTTPAGKERLLPAMSPGNLEKTKSAPVTVIVGCDMQFHLHMERLFPHYPGAKDMFGGNDGLRFETAKRNATLTGAYFMIAARALGLDCGPMSGFDQDKVNAEFFPDGRFTVNFIVNLGYGDGQNIFDRGYRFSFDEACQVL